MRAEIINVGTELLIGSTLNTHQQYLAREMGGLGIDLYTAVTLGDNPQRLAAALTTALLRSDLVLVTGGLGPTDDDITVETVARALGLPLVPDRAVHAAIRRRLEARGRTMNAFQARQALLPRGARAFPNPNGTAPGIFVTVRRRGRTGHVALLPGPPRELQPMVRDHLLPRLRSILGPARETLVVKRLLFPGAVESEIAPKVNDLLNAPPPVTTGIYAKVGEVALVVMSKHRRAADAERMARAAAGRIRNRFKDHFILEGEQTPASYVADRLLRSRSTLACAESCTGGLISARITDLAGSSAYFKGGIVAYSNAVKSEVLGLDPEKIRKEGAVSEATAAGMAEAVRRRMKTDYGLATTGIAGPSGGSASKPVGTVFIAIAGPGGTRVHRHLLLGNRSDVRQKTVQTALTHLAVTLRSAGRTASKR